MTRGRQLKRSHGWIVLVVGAAIVAARLLHTPAPPQVPVSAQGATPDLDGQIGCDQVCPAASASPVEVCTVELFTAGLAASPATVAGYWLVTDSDGPAEWISDGEFRVSPGGVWRTRDMAESASIACLPWTNVLAYGWQQLSGERSDYSRLDAQLIRDRCNCCFASACTRTPSPTPKPCLGCTTGTPTFTPGPTSTGTPFTATPTYTPSPSITPIPTQDVVGTCSLNSGEDYLDWRQWYPLYVGQGTGQRAVNWFDNLYACAADGFNGLSLWDYPGTPHSFPAEYDGECLNYYWLWGCRDPNCQFDPSVPNLIVELLTISRDGRYLDRWGMGFMKSWFEIYFDPTMLPCKCELNDIRNYFYNHPGDLTSMDFRVPFRWFSYKKPGESWNSPKVCAVKFSPAVTPDGGVNLSICSITEATLEFVRTTPVEYSADCKVLKMVNEYYQSDCHQIDTWCGNPPEAYCNDPRCARPGRAKRFSYPALTPTPTPTGTWIPTATATATNTTTPAPTKAGHCTEPGDCEWCLNNYEAYVIEKMVAPGQGSLANLAYSWKFCSSDDCRNFQIEDFQPGPRQIESVQPSLCAPQTAFWDRVGCPPNCNDCPQCSTPTPSTTRAPQYTPTADGTELCCPTPTPVTYTPTPNATIFHCQACPLIQGMPTTRADCCGNDPPAPPTPSTLEPGFWSSVAGTCPPTRTPGPPPSSTATPTGTPSTPTPTPPWTPACCAITPELAATYIESIPSPTPDSCSSRDQSIENQFIISQFCGNGTDHYSVRLIATVCCTNMTCSPTGTVADWYAYNASGIQIDRGTIAANPDNPFYWQVDLPCRYGDSGDGSYFPVKWRVVSRDTTLRPEALSVAYRCCYSGNCPPTATASP